MKRWWLVIVLLLSLGVNLGLLAAVAAQRRQPPPPRQPPAARESPRAEERPAAPQPSPAPPAGEPVTVVEAPEPPAPAPERPVRREERPAGPRQPPFQEDEGPLPGPPDGPPGGPEPGMEEGPPRIPPLPRLADHLGLEGEKRRRFLEIQWQFFQRTSRLRLQQSEVQRELRRSLSRGEPDRQAIDRLLQESARIHLALERALVENVVTSRELLSDEQTRLFLQLLGRMRREAGRNPEGPPPPGAGRRPLRRWQEGQGRPFDRRLPRDERGGPPPPLEENGPPPPP